MQTFKPDSLKKALVDLDKVVSEVKETELLKNLPNTGPTIWFLKALIILDRYEKYHNHQQLKIDLQDLGYRFNAQPYTEIRHVQQELTRLENKFVSPTTIRTFKKVFDNYEKLIGADYL